MTKLRGAGLALEFRSRHEAVEVSAGREFPVAGTARFGHLPAMTITARVHNRTIALLADVEIAEGAEVQVIVPEKVPANSQRKGEAPDWLRKAVGAATGGLSTDEIMRRTRGEFS